MLFDVFVDSYTIFAQQPMLMLMAIAAVAMGIVLGALPGVSSTMALAILLPLTFGVEPGVAMMLLLMVLVSSVFGGSISAILLNIPGTPGAIVTQFDGYPMAQQGRAGHALGHALIAATVGGVLGVIALMMIAPVIAKSAMSFRSPEFALLALFGLVLLAYTVEGAMLAGLMSGAIGLIFGMVGFDTVSGVARFDFGSAILQNGIDIIPVTIGIFGITEVLTTLSAARRGPLPSVPKIGSLIPPRHEIARVWPSWLRGSTTGTLIGAIPAAGSAIAVAVAYALERRFTRGEARFGRGGAARGRLARSGQQRADRGGHDPAGYLGDSGRLDVGDLDRRSYHTRPATRPDDVCRASRHDRHDLWLVDAGDPFDLCSRHGVFAGDRSGDETANAGDDGAHFAFVHGRRFCHSKQPCRLGRDAVSWRHGLSYDLNPDTRGTFGFWPYPRAVDGRKPAPHADP